MGGIDAPWAFLDTQEFDTPVSCRCEREISASVQQFRYLPVPSPPWQGAQGCFISGWRESPRF